MNYEPCEARILNTIEQATSRLATSRSKIYEKISIGALDAVKLDGRTMIPEASLQAFAASLPRASIGAKEAA